MIASEKEQGMLRQNKKIMGEIKDKLPLLWGATAAVVALGMIVHSVSMFHLFELTPDFANFYQATYLIAHGHLYPYDTVFPHNYPHYGFPFLKSHGEVFTWALAPLIWLSPSGVALLVAQDLAIAGSQLLAALCIHAILQKKGVVTEVITTLVFVFLNPWYYFAAFFDFHLEPFALLFLTALIFSYIDGKRYLAAVLAILVASTGDVPATYLVGVGLGLFLISPRKNRSALFFAAFGLFVFVFDSLLHLNEASSLLSRYGYLAGNKAPLNVGSLLVGVLSHLNIAFETLRGNAKYVAPFLGSGGVIGLLTPLGLAISAVVLMGPLLVPNATFLHDFDSFQVIAIEPALAISGALLIAWTGKNRERLLAKVAEAALWLSVVSAVVITYPNLLSAKDFNATVTRGIATDLSRTLRKIPNTAEVIVANGVAGRFAARRLIYPIVSFQNIYVPIWSHTTYVVVSTQGISDPTAMQLRVISHFLSSESGSVRALINTPTVSVYEIKSKSVGYYLRFPPTA